MRILAILAASYAVAAALAVYGRLDGLLPLLCILSALAAVGAGCLVRRTGRRGKLAALCAAGLALGFGWTAAYQNLFFAPARDLAGQTVRLTAQVLQWPRESTRGGLSVLVRTQTPAGVGVDTLLYVDGQGTDLRPGDQIGTVARLNLADRASSGEEITYYTAKGVFLRGTAYGTLAIQRPERAPLRALPALLSRALERSILDAFPEGVGAQVLAIVTGSRNNLTQPFTTSLQRTGLSHTAAVSGMHLAFLAGFLTTILGKHRRRTSLIIMPAILVFMVTAGCTPSVVRATVMILLLLSAPLVGRERDDLTALGTALLVLLVQNPLAVAHVGLQLSFAAVAGIFLASEPIQRSLTQLLHIQQSKRWSGRWFLNLLPNYLVSSLAATLGALVFTLPLTALHFSSVSLIAPLSNFLTLWAVAILFCGGLLVGLAGLACPGLASLLAVGVTPFARYLDAVTRGLSRMTFAAVTMDSGYYKAWVCCVCAGVLLALAGRRKKRLLLPGLLAAVTLLSAMALTALDFHAGPVKVSALDVGQGQCTVVRQGSFVTMIDCGGDSYDDAGDIAANYLQNAGQSRVDLLVLTHFHQDHANGVPQLLERLEVKEIAMPEEEGEDPLRQKILELAREKGIACRVIRKDTVLELDENSTLTIYAPLGGREINERGLTVLASTGKFDALFTGDMGTQVEQLLLAHARLPDIELLMVGHHGSKNATSQNLLEAVRPELALISVGAHNYYGHPAPETLERLAGCEIHRTDQEGAITVYVSKNGV